MNDVNYKQAALSYLRRVPLSLCVRELNRLLAIEKLDDQFQMCDLSPVLDIGCGDGFWWTLRNKPNSEIYGIDISHREIRQAKRNIKAVLADISLEVPFKHIKFQQVIGNCSLEHVPQLHLALHHIKQTAEQKAKLILFVPAPRWAYQGIIQKFLLKHFPRVSMMISGAMNGFFQHWHLYEVPIWEKILEHSGWKIIHSQGIGNARTEFLFRLFLPSSFIGFLCKKITGYYPNHLLRWCPEILLLPWHKLLMWSLHKPLVSTDSETAYEFVIIAEVSNDKPKR